MLCLFISSATLAQTITINEVMFDPMGSEYYDEFIEIVNIGDSAISLGGSYLEINGSIDSLYFPNSDTLAPNSYALILDRGYLIDNNSNIYDELIPDNALLLTIQGATFGSNGLLNSSPNTLYLISYSGDTLSTVSTTPGQSEGYSDEKILIDGSNSPENWGNSTDIYGTPGFKNSIFPRDYDLAIITIGLLYNDTVLGPGATVELYLTIRNVGLNKVNDAELVFGVDSDGDSILRVEEVLQTDILTIDTGDSVKVYPILTNVQSGKYVLLGVIKTEDDNPANNTATYTLKVPYQTGSIIINEFMYAPKTDFGGEWAELLNISEDTVNLANWQIGDNSSSTEISVIDIMVPPSEYVLLSSDESITIYWDLGGIFVHCEKSLPMLNNTEDSIVVRDLCGQVIDSLKYSSSWGNRQGVSLERIDPYKEGDISGNWALSQNSKGGTPGYNNSVMIKDFDLAVSGVRLLDDTACPKPGSTADLYINIKNIGRETINDAEFYLGIDNNRDSVLQENEVLYVDVLTVGPGDSVVLYPRILVVKSGKNLIIGSVVSGDDDNENNTKYFLLNVLYPTGCMVINEFMYVPKTDFGGEWIELLNISEDTVNLANWRIGDNSSRVAISATDIMVPPSEYVLLSSTESITNYWEINGIYVHCKNSLPTLNNTEDSIVVRDLCGQVIDSLKYSSNWGYQQGVSLERIDPNRDSNVSGNWAMSQNSVGGTPGYMNSRMVKTHDLSIDTIYVVSEDMVHDEPVEFEFVVGNNGCADIGAYSIHLGVKPMTQEMNETAIIDTLLYFETTIKAGAHQKKSFFAESVPGGIYQVFCEVFLSDDEQSSNDQDSCVFVVGYPENSVVVNEVMNVPESGESEWFELYNTSDMDINLNRWTFRDAGGGWRTLTTETEIITADGFCIVAAKQDFRQTYPQFSGNLIVPENFPILNNSSDSLFLADGSDGMIEAVCFRQEWGGATGISIERKDPNAPALSEFNWGSSDDPAGATPGIENSILKYQYDLKIIPGSFVFVDSTVALIRPVSFQIGIINSGSQESNRFSLEVYYDVNGDNKASPGELVWSLHNIPPLLPDSTILLDGEIYSEKSGRCHYLAIVAMSDDENTKDNIITTDLLVAYPKQSVVINEFLAYPNSDQVEFIELIHRGGDNINLNEWTLADSRSATGLSQPIMLESGKFLVLVRDSSFFEYNSVDNFQVIVPEKWPGLSNTADKIILRDLTGTVIDSLAYNDEWDIVPGVSLEKRLPEDPGEQRQFWFLSQSVNGSTPGADNSVMPRLFDIKLDSIKLGQYDGNIESEVEITCWFSNIGRSSCYAAQISVQENRQTIITKNIGEIVPGSQDSAMMNIEAFESGIHRLQVFVDWAEDINPGNDTLGTEIRTSYTEGKFFLSEFMAIPRDVITENGSNSEYIEIFNPSEEIQLEGWMICDENTGAPVEIREQKTISAGGYFVFAADSSVFHFAGVKLPSTVVLKKFPSLNNTADAIYLKDPTGKTIDSLIYNSQWAVPQYISMERVYFSNPNIISNWRYSTGSSGGTPGHKNSVAIEDDTDKSGIKTDPNPFSPNGDGFDDEVAIIYKLPFPSAKVTVQIYDLVGRLIYEPARNITTSSDGAVYWDGSSKHGNKARIGMYVVRCSATDAASDKTVGYITTVVLAR